ncbi:MAG: hypothetical protein R3E76_14810 [Planctomycetota bacterium]
MAETLPNPGDPNDEALKELAQAIGVDVATLGATALGGPITGVAVGGFLTLCKSIYSTFAQAKVNKAFYEYLKLLAKYTARLNEEIDRRATWAYVTDPDNVAELVNMGETIAKARDQEKVRAALNHQVNKTLSRGRDNPDLRDFISAFIRDCTGLDIRVLAALPTPDAYKTTRNAEVGDATLETIAEHLRDSLGMNNPEGIALIDGAVGRLGMPSLCKAMTGFEPTVYHPPVDQSWENKF